MKTQTTKPAFLAHPRAHAEAKASLLVSFPEARVEEFETNISINGLMVVKGNRIELPGRMTLGAGSALSLAKDLEAASHYVTIFEQLSAKYFGGE
jgi:hypothetical protein